MIFSNFTLTFIEPCQTVKPSNLSHLSEGFSHRLANILQIWLFSILLSQKFLPLYIIGF